MSNDKTLIASAFVTIDVKKNINSKCFFDNRCQKNKTFIGKYLLVINMSCLCVLYMQSKNSDYDLGVVTLRYQHIDNRVHNSHKHSQSPLTMFNAL